RLDEAIAALRLVDSKGQLAYVLDVAAALDLEDGRLAVARERAVEALGCAETVGRPSETALARALLAQAAARAGARDGAVPAPAPGAAAGRPPRPPAAPGPDRGDPRRRRPRPRSSHARSNAGIDARPLERDEEVRHGPFPHHRRAHLREPGLRGGARPHRPPHRRLPRRLRRHLGAELRVARSQPDALR